MEVFRKNSLRRVAVFLAGGAPIDAGRRFRGRYSKFRAGQVQAKYSRSVED
jgi:hypothetical protein